MNAKDYGHHFSGYRKPEATEPSQGFMSRLVFWILVFAVCIGWVMTHTGCAHPIGNGLAALMGFGLVPLRLLCLGQPHDHPIIPHRRATQRHEPEHVPRRIQRDRRRPRTGHRYRARRQRQGGGVMRAYGFGFCVIEGGFIVLIALNWGEGDALRGVLLAWLAVHIFLSLPIIAAIPESILGHIYERKGRAQLAAWRAANDRSSEASEAMERKETDHGSEQ